MKVNLLCSLRNIDEAVLQEVDTDWIGVDRGTVTLIDYNISPVAAVGDFDSVDESELTKIKNNIDVKSFKKEKDDTDLALAVNLAVDLGYSEINIYGATGGRLDHFMGAVQILAKPEFLSNDLTIAVIDQQNHIQVLKSGKHKVEKIQGMKYISFVPLNSNIRIKLDDLKYELPFTTLQIGSTLTISNEFQPEKDCGYVQVEFGNLLMIQSRD